MQSQATTVPAYLAELPAERRAVVSAVRDLVNAHLDRDYEEGLNYGMIGWYVPHRIFPPGYHCNPKLPLPFAGLAAQKNHYSLYLMSLYGEGPHWNDFEAAWKKSGKKLDMGKCCIRFKKVEDLATEVIADAVRRTPASVYVAHYQSALARNASPGGRAASRKARAAATQKSAAKKASVASRKSAAKGAASATGSKRVVKKAAKKKR
jgi:hypothetical protein